MTASAAMILLCAGGFAAPAAQQPDGAPALRFVLPAAPAGAETVLAPGNRPAPVEALSAAPQIPDGDAQPDEEPEQLAAASVPVPTTVAAPAARAKVAGLIPLSYNLAGGAKSGDAIEVDKPVSFAGADAGRIPLRIDGNARVYALGSRLAEIIARQSGEGAVPKGLDQDFVSLDRLRALGIGVRYDAIRDRLVVDPPA